MPTTSKNLSIVLLIALLATCSFAADAQQLPGPDQLPSIKELPDPFLFTDGSRVKSKDDWAKRRSELKQLIQAYEYGHLPPAPANVSAEVLTTTTASSGQTNFTVKEILLSMGPDRKVSTHLILTIPSGKGRFPVVITGDLGWGKVKPEIALECARRGYMLAEFNREEVNPDKNDHTKGVWAAYPQNTDTSALAAWAWGYSRVIDYLYTLDNVDKTRIAITGHSRGGKATLLAGAMDERIALVNPNNSGCGGAGCYRFQAPKSEDIVAITKNFPFWFAPRFREFIGKTDRLPFDQHSLKALVAPRALLTTEALGDLWANPQGTQQTHQAAKVVYDWLGASDNIAIYFRQGGHQQALPDWLVLLDFADRVFFGRTNDRKFNQLAFPDAPKVFSWQAPQ